jgi:hypothetical protein
MTSPPFSSIARQAERMREMIDRLDVDTIKLACLGEGASYVQARLKCLDCSNTERCFQWLETSPPNAERPTFCPNLSLFESCKRGDEARTESRSD